MAISPSQILIHVGGNVLKLHGTASRRVAPIARRGEDVIETFARATPPASYRDAGGEVKLAEVDALRVNMLDLDVAGVFDVPAIGLEDTRQNVCLRSEEIENAAYINVGTPVVTANDAIAPDGKTTADKIEDNDGAVSEGRQQSITIANDSTTWCVSVYVKKALAAAPVVILRVQLTGGTTKDAILAFDPIINAKIANADVVNSGVIVEGDYFRIWLTVANNTTGNVTILPTLYPAGRATGDVGSAALVASATGSNHFWGVQVENAASPSSYIATVASTVTRARDITTFPWVASPRTMIGYARFVERGTILTTNGHIFQIGDNTQGNDPRFILRVSGGNYQTIVDDGAAFKSSIAVAAPSYGDIVELRLAFDKEAGTIQLHQSINAGAEVTATAGTGLDPSLMDVWAGTLLTVNAAGDSGLNGYIDLLDLMFADGAGHSVADFRAATQQ